MKTQLSTTQKPKNNFYATRRKSLLERADPWGIFVIGSTFVLMIGAVYLAYILQSDFTQFNLDRSNSTFGAVFMNLALGLFAFKVIFFLFIGYKYFKYKAIPSVSDEELPTCTVIVPAYNEGKQVYDTLLRLVMCDFPKEKLQL